MNPVDPATAKGYSTVILTPICISDLREAIEEKQCTNESTLWTGLALLCANALTYNQLDSPIALLAYQIYSDLYAFFFHRYGLPRLPPWLHKRLPYELHHAFFSTNERYQPTELPTVLASLSDGPATTADGHSSASSQASRGRSRRQTMRRAAVAARAHLSKDESDGGTASEVSDDSRRGNHGRIRRSSSRPLGRSCRGNNAAAVPRSATVVPASSARAKPEDDGDSSGSSCSRRPPRAHSSTSAADSNKRRSTAPGWLSSSWKRA